MKIAIHITSIICFICFLSCKNEIKQDATAAETITNTDSLSVADTSAQKYPAWILEFQRLRQALYQNDTAAIKSFFDFPLTVEQCDDIVAIMSFRTEKTINKKPVFKTGQHFADYIQYVFPSDFVKGLLPIKSDTLFKNNFAASDRWKIENDDVQYSSSVFYDESDKSLSLSLNAAYGIEADGNEENKTESAAILIFKLNKENKLKFDRVIMAG